MPRISKEQRAAAPNSSCGREAKVHRVAVYVRLSDEDIRKKISDSIGTQKSMLLRFIETQPDMRLYQVYEDVSYTGTNFNRPGFTRMMEDIQAGLVDCVLVKDLSRFGRSFEETGNFLERVFPFLGVRFISLGDHYDSFTASTDESGLLIPLKNLMNEVYARDISRKVQASVKMKQKRGEFVSSVAPYGYIKNGTCFVVDEETAPVVRQIFSWIIEGHSDIAIAGMLNEQKILPPSRYRFEKGITKAEKHENTRFWYKSAVNRISVNPAYTGVMAQGKRQSNFLQGGGIIYTNREEWIVTPDAHTAIIDSETFEAVQRIRSARKQNYKVSDNYVPHENIFKGRIVCGDCKSYMVRKKQRRVAGDVYYFGCNLYEQVDKNACTYKRVMESDVHMALYAYISREISLAVDTNRIIDKLRKQDSFRAQRNTLDKQIDAVRLKLTHNRHFRGSLHKDFTDGILTEQDYTMMRADYDTERDNLRQELNALLADKERQDSTLSSENKWIAAFRTFETEQALSAPMVAALVERIEVYDSNRINVTLRYRDEFAALQDHIHSLTEKARAVGE